MAIENKKALEILRIKWTVFTICGLGLCIGTFFWLRTWWGETNSIRWFVFSSIALFYLLWVLWQGLQDNHRHAETQLLPQLGLGNILSISRGLILVLFCGFLFSPWPNVGWTAWLPGMLYTLAALPDFADGAAARLTNHVTKLGETLDLSIDSIGVLSVSLLSVQYGQVPGWYLLVGLARYIFLGGSWIRRQRGLPNHNLDFSVRRRGYAGVTMGLFFVILYPIFTPPGTHVVAVVFAFYLLGGFLWDWCLTIGWLPPQPGKVYFQLEKIVTQYVPLVLRLILVYWGVAKLLPKLAFEPNSALLWAEASAVTCICMGLAGRTFSFAALVILGLYQTAAPLTVAQLWLIALYANLLFLGTGMGSLWPLENWVIFHRIGDSQ